jgi:DNA-binding GntR family transcriptional regulator
MIYLTKSEYIYQALKDEILEGSLPEGSRIIIADVTKKYGVSPMPIREAISKLQKYGYVEVEPHQGARVASMDLSKLKEITILRNELEPLVAKLATPYIDEPLIQELDELIVLMEEAMVNEDRTQYEKLNKEFHHKIYDRNPYSYIKELNDELWNKSEISKVVLTKAPNRLQESLKEHKMWLQAIKDNDPDEVARVVKLHKTNAFQELEKVMGNH